MDQESFSAEAANADPAIDHENIGHGQTNSPTHGSPLKAAWPTQILSIPAHPSLYGVPYHNPHISHQLSIQTAHPNGIWYSPAVHPYYEMPQDHAYGHSTCFTSQQQSPALNYPTFPNFNDNLAMLQQTHLHLHTNAIAAPVGVLDAEVNMLDMSVGVPYGGDEVARRGSFGSSSGRRSLDGYSLASSDGTDFQGMHTPIGSNDSTQGDDGLLYSVVNPSHTLQIHNSEDGEQSNSSEMDHSFLDRLEDTSFRPPSPDYSEFIDYDAVTPHAGSDAGDQPMSPQTATVSSRSVSSEEPYSPVEESGQSPLQKKVAPARKSGNSPTRKSSKSGVDKEKRVGRRKGALRPEQRRAAAEIRKMGACLRCKFLKKTCSGGNPCHNCLPSHTRLWTVPCTRMDIRQMDYFLKGWNIDTARHITLAISIDNIVSFGDEEFRIWVGHDFGMLIPIKVREVVVRNNEAFVLEWSEFRAGTRRDDTMHTAHLAMGKDDDWKSMLDEYLTEHVRDPRNFSLFVDTHFDNSKFLPGMLKLAREYVMHSKDTTIVAALKMFIAYNLTFKVIIAKDSPGVCPQYLHRGLVKDPDSKFYERIIGPAFVNFQIKNAMAAKWRELLRDVLDDMSKFIRGTYNGEHLTNWPTILFGAFIILSMMEEMQFDTHKRAATEAEAQTFCLEMEAVPAAVFTGMFRAISQKLPSFLDWNPADPPEAMQPDAHTWDLINQVADLVQENADYLKSLKTKFDPDDVDSLTNKFNSELVLWVDPKRAGKKDSTTNSCTTSRR